MRVLITGGSGFVGRRVARLLLSAGHEVRNLDVRPAAGAAGTDLVGDIGSLEVCRAAVRDVDVVCHLAALYRDDVRPRSLYYEVNVEGTRNIVRAITESGVSHLVFASSFSVYGLEDAGRSEDGALDPVNDYGRSKLQAEAILREWHAAAPGRCLQVLRPCVIFGEGGRGNVWTLVNQIASGRFVMIGVGANRKSMAYVGNIAEFIRRLIERRQAGSLELYNYADKPDMTMREIVDTAAATLNRRVARVPLPGATAMSLGYAGDLIGAMTRRVLTVNSERVRKFLADTSLPTGRLEASGFVRPFELRTALIETIRFDFPAARQPRTQG